jgi:hypothetical protein
VPAALAVLALLAASAACGGPRQADDGWRAVLAARGRAVLSGDRAAFLGTVDPAAGAFRAAQARVFTNLRRLPFAEFDYRVAGTGAFPVAGPGEVAVAARLEYELRGYDRAPVTADAYLTMVRRAGHWYLASQTGGEPVGKHTAVQPWDTGTLTVVTGARSLVLGAGGAAALRGYAALADRAVPVVAGVWPGGWARRAIVEVPGGEAGMAALLGAPATAYQGIAAVTTAEVRGGGSAPADRVIVNPQAFAELSAFGRRVVLTHELTHVATRTATTSRTPLWLSEGFADWVAYRGSGRTARQIAPELRADVVAGKTPAALPSAADFAPGAGGIAQAYEGAWLACRMIADGWGDARLIALYRAAGRQGAAAAVRGTLGMGEAEFTARWRAYVTKELA